MNRIEKFIMGSILLALGASFTLYGLWEDKMTFLPPLIVLVYAALTAWAVGALRPRQRSDIGSQKSAATDQDAEIAGLTSDFAEGIPTLRGRSLISGNRVPPGGILLLLFWFYSAVMIPFSTVPYEARISVLRFGCYLGVYWASANILSRFPRRKTVWTAIFFCLLLVALYSLVQHKINPEMLFGTERYTNYGERLGGTYICPNHIAHLFQMWIPFCLVFLFIPQFGWFWRICFGYALPVFGLLIYRTQSRAGLLGAVAATGVLMLLLMLRKSRRAFLVALVAVPLFVIAAIGGLWAGSSMFRDRMQPVVKVLAVASEGDWEKVISLDFRPMTWADASVMFMDRPLTGFGPGNYGQVFPEYRTRLQTVRVETVHPHNEPIELITEYGLIGTGLFIWAVVSIFISLIRLIKTSPRLYHALPAAALLAALAGTLVHGLFDFELRIFPNALMLALLAGCAVAPVMRSDAEPKKHSLWGHWIFAVCMMVAALCALQSMSSATLQVWGDKYRLEQDRSRAEKFYTVSIAVDPQNWMAHLGLGQVYSYYRYQALDPVKKAEWAALERDTFAAAYRYNSKKEEVVYGLGRAELAAGNCEAGLDALRQAAAYKRFNDFYWRKLGIELRKAGLYDEALETFLYARKLNRSNATVSRNIQWLKQRLGEE